ncbi:hypothetical protein PQQ65_32855 [Paraburkholderia strydomiana]|uniref:hypothetical protein n=1 Tax=Paraburkholderia strydomiana TaxID=1245417 RepID=UPI0038B8FBB9
MAESPDGLRFNVDQLLAPQLPFARGKDAADNWRLVVEPPAVSEQFRNLVFVREVRQVAEVRRQDFRYTLEVHSL